MARKKTDSQRRNEAFLARQAGRKKDAPENEALEDKVSLKYLSDLSISYRRGWKSRTSRRKEIGNMELLVEWLLFVLGEDYPLAAAPASGG